MLKYFKKNKGFTLIELLVVIAIIAVLASIVLVSLNTARIKGRDTRRIADIKSLQVAMEMYFDKNGKYPSPASDDATGAEGALDLLKTGGLIAAIPKDPGTGAYYKYSADSTSAATKYHLAAVLEEAGHSAIDVDADKDETYAATGVDIFGGKVGCVTGGAVEDSANGTCYDVIP